MGGLNISLVIPWVEVQTVLIRKMIKEKIIYYLKSDEGDLLSKNVKEKISEEIRLAESLHHDKCQNC